MESLFTKYIYETYALSFENIFHLPLELALIYWTNCVHIYEAPHLPQYKHIYFVASILTRILKVYSCFPPHEDLKFDLHHPKKIHNSSINEQLPTQTLFTRLFCL